MPGTVPLTVVVLTKNEEKRLPDCLESVRFADELLVVDDESTDRTEEVALRHGAKVLHRKMEMEGRHRNWAAQQARNDWILSVDADERVTPELAAEIQELFQGTPPFKVYSVPRRNFIGKRWLRHGGWYPSPQVKLYDRTVFKWEEALVHCRAISDQPTGSLKGDLIHYSYRDISDFVGKLDRQTTLEAGKWVKDGRKMTKGKALWRTLDRFCRAWIGKKGHRDGFLGFVVAVFGGFYQFLSWTKYEELRRGTAALSPPPAGYVPRVSRKETVSVVLMTKNEAHRLPLCLDRVAGWADEIVIIDDLSEDGTPEVARRYTEKVFSYRSDNDHFKQWNRGIEHSTADWILHIDADELVTPRLKAEIDQALSDHTPHAGFQVMRKNFYLGHPMLHGGWYHRHMNFFRRRGSRCIGTGIHATVTLDGTVGQLDADIEHYPFTSISQFIQRQNIYTSTEATVLVEKRPHVRHSEIVYQTAWRPLELWWKFYIKKAGRRDGWPGLVFSVLWAFVHFLLWVKYWELTRPMEES